MNLLSFLRGYVQIECEGGYPETFLNLAAAQHLPLWEVRRHEASLWCCVYAADYRRLRPVARKACVRMRVRQKFGLPHRLHRRKLRPGLLVGPLLFMLVLQLLSSRIWVVRVTGNHTVSEQAILTELAAMGVCEGARFDRVDITDLRLTALQRLPDLVRLSVNQSGSIVTVEVAERTATEPLQDAAPTNLVAACDGVILNVSTVRGQAVVQAGDAVRKGDLLISGVMDSTVGPQLKHADGSVLARTTHTLTVEVPLQEEVPVHGKELVRPKLSLFGWHIPLYTGGTPTGTPTITTERRSLTANGVPLPLSLDVTRLRYDTTVTVTRTKKEALATAEKQLALVEADLQKTLTVESRSLTSRATENRLTLTAVYRGTQELAVEAPIQ